MEFEKLFNDSIEYTRETFIGQRRGPATCTTSSIKKILIPLHIFLSSGLSRRLGA